MSLQAGTKLGRYEIRAKIGEGGMGEVYRAFDPTIHREVAIKVLPASVADDADRLKRFEQEACAAGSLNHPNILIIHHVDTDEGAPYIVSELLEGQTLRQRLGGTAFAPRRAIDYANQIARGLAAAHEKGIVHRDLKPDNIFITNDGRVKILDFGIAKLTQPDSSQPQTGIPTRRVDTDPGKVLGTVGYMSPEQVKGRAVDHRSDVFSFGAILYEMLSGRRAFHGESAAETMSAILKEDPPDLSETNQRISPALERLVHHCLEKNPEERFHSARDLAFALEALSGTSPTSSQTTAMSALPARRMTRRELVLASVAAVAILAVVALAAAMAISYFRRSPTEDHSVRFAINPPEKTGFSSFAISPDGLRLTFVATEAAGKTLLWVRPLDSTNAQQLPGTEDAALPFWSPDSRFIGFFAAGKLKKIEVASGVVQTLSKNTPVPRGGTWSQNGVIVFVPTPNDPLYQVSVAGGEPTQLTRIDTAHQEASHRWPYFLPDGRHVLYSVQGGPQSQGIYVTSLDGKENRRLLNVVNSTVAFAAPGFLFFRRESTLMAQAFDADKLQLAGEPFPVAEPVGYEIATFQTFFSVSQTGVLAYSSGSTGGTQLALIDRTGKELGRVGQPGNYLRPTLSPEGKRVAVDGVDSQGNRDIWLVELASGNPTRFTFDPATDIFPVWSPDGSRLVFSSDRQGPRNIYQKSATGAGKEELLYKTDANIFPSDWSADGRFILYLANDPKTRLDVWVLPLAGDQKPFPFLQTEANERAARFSPDGRWIAYTSDESGINQIYVQSFPDGGGKRQISVNGGYWLAWRSDGKELFYVAADKKMMAVGVQADGPNFEVGTPKALFDVRVQSFTSVQAQFAVFADGQKFLVANSYGELTSAPIEVVLNWTAAVRK
ncbi:MAG TPA: protein kinase [Pyrinomonadaceae bacterium]|jgi:serine/threonine protein kinase|nr:protein kinase [Pyrinomonadaceae bacterium]